MLKQKPAIDLLIWRNDDFLVGTMTALLRID